jgi:glycerol-3-phosphate responsive antiterminator
MRKGSIARRTLWIVPTWSISVSKQVGTAAAVKRRLLEVLPGVQGRVVGDDAGTDWVFVVVCTIRTRENLQRALQQAGIRAQARVVRSP